MNNYDFLAPRRRRQSLFIVEGNHEKNTLIKLLLKCFPEIDIKEDDIVIYGTNIYMLYDALVEYYGQNWYEIDVDLAYVVSQKKRYTTSMYKSDFNNIVMIFDYEHHDPKFSEDKICILQEYFSNSTDVGKLFVNYHEILSKCYLTAFKYTESEILELLNMERSTFYDRKKEAILLLGVSLWGYAIPMFKGIFAGPGECEYEEIPDFFLVPT